MKEERNVPFRNYLILSILLILSVIIVIYFYMWYGEFYNTKINTPIIDEYLNVINYNELDTYLIENKNVIVYTSNLYDEKSRNFEKKFVKIIEDYSLSNKIIYLDLTEQYKDKNLYNFIVDKYNLLDLPCIITFNNGIVDDIYSIEDRNYDINLLISYLKIKEIIYD